MSSYASAKLAENAYAGAEVGTVRQRGIRRATASGRAQLRADPTHTTRHRPTESTIDKRRDCDQTAR